MAKGAEKLAEERRDPKVIFKHLENSCVQTAQTYSVRTEEVDTGSAGGRFGGKLGFHRKKHEN